MTLLKISAAALLFLLTFAAAGATTAEQAGYSAWILQYVEQDKVYLLENLRARVTKNSEKTVIDALLAEDGPKAARLFERQLSVYPDPALDSLSKARLSAYNAILSAPRDVRSPSKEPGFILQFGSFGSLKNARELADRVAAYLPVTIVKRNKLHKVRSRGAFASRKEAAGRAEKLPFNSFILQGE